MRPMPAAGRVAGHGLPGICRFSMHDKTATKRMFRFIAEASVKLLNR